MLAAMMALYVALFSWHVWLKYRYYLYSDIDCAMFVQAVEAILRGSLFSSIRGMTWLGDHSSLILYLIAPIYAVARHPVTLPILQTVALALGAIPVFSLARRELGAGVLPVVFAAVYLLYPAVGYTNLYEFHPEVLCTPLLLAAFASYRADRFGATVLFAGLSLLGKEDIALPVLALAVYSTLDSRQPRRFTDAAAFAGLAIASLVISFAVLKPALSAGEVDYGRMYLDWGRSPGEVTLSLLRQPLRALSAFFTSPGYDFDTVLKLQFYLHLLLPLAFLPLLAPRTLAIVVPTLATHFLSWRSAQHTIYYQYTALLTPFLMAAAVLGLRGLLQRKWAAVPDPPGRAGVAALVLLVAMLAGNWMFGPLWGHGTLQFVTAEEAIAPTGKDRALTRHRDRMVSEVGRRDRVVLGFEFLTRFASRREVHSFHNIVGGLKTFSTEPYTPPAGVTALLADVSHSRLRVYADSGTADRVGRLLRDNHLGLADAAGDILLFLQNAPDRVRVWSEGERPVPIPQRVVFDRQLAFLGNELAASSVAPGGTLPVRTFWRRVASTDSLYVLQFTAFDARERPAFATMRYLGYMLHPPATWPDTTMVCEDWGMVIPDDARPGSYMLGMRVGRRSETDQVLCDTDDPRIRAQNMVVELGRFTVLPSR